MINTLSIIAEQVLLHVPLMLGAYISFSLLKVPDLSIESAYVVGALIGSKVLIGMQGMPMGLVLPAVLLASAGGGALVGLTSSIITQQARIPHLLSCIITSGLFHGITQLVSSPYVSFPHDYNPLTLLGTELTTIAIIGASVTVCCSYVLCKQLGYAFAIYGNNPYFFGNYGISTVYIFITGIAMSNALAGISGYLIAQSSNFLELNMGAGKALLCITALIIGKSLTPTKKPFSSIIPLVGTGAYFALQQSLLKAGFNLKYFTAVQALLVLIILVYTYHSKQNRGHIDNLGV